jgi:tape measure domain-containing protein
MSTDLEQLVLSISADTAQMRRALKRIEGDVNSSTRNIERRFDALGKKIGSSFDGLGRSLRASVAGLAGSFSLREAQRLIDSASRIQNALRATGVEGDNLTAVYNQLFASAQRNAAPLEEMVTLYSRISLAQKDLGVTSAQVVGLVDTVGKAIKASGGDAQQASGALLQLGQALGGGKVQAEEYNSLIDGLPVLLQAAAAGIDKAGGSVGKLTALVKSGEVSSKAFFDGIAAGSSIIDGRLATAEETISGGFVRLQNVLIDVASRFDDSTGASRSLAHMIDSTLIPAIRELGGIFTWVTEGPIGQFYEWLGKTIDRVTQLSADFGALSGLDKIGGNPYIGQGRIQERIDGAFAGSTYSTSKTSRKPTEITATKPNSVIRPITLADYPVDGDGKGKKKRTPKERADEYERLSKRIADTTAEMVAETEAQRQLNPLVNDYGYAAEKARMERELLTAAEEAGKKITPELRAEIAALADQYAMAGVESAKLAETQDELRQAFEDTRELGKDVMGGFISDLVEGKSASEALAGALKKVGDRLLEIAMNDLFGKTGSNGMGILGQIFGGIFGGGGGAADPWGGMRAAGGPVQKGKAYVVGEKRPELFVPDQSGSILPSVPQMPALATPSGGAIHVSYSPVYSLDNANAEAVARIEQMRAKDKAEMPALIVKTVRDARARRIL